MHKAKISLTLQADNSFSGHFDGQIIDLGNMLHYIASGEEKAKAVIYVAAMALLKDDGELEAAKVILQRLQDMPGNHNQKHKKMEIEVGKQYLTRDGHTATIRAKRLRPTERYFGLVCIKGTSIIRACNWDAAGLLSSMDDERDLMEEIKTTELQPNKNTNVDGLVFLTENDISELAQIGSQHLYLGEMDEGRLSYGGVLEIIKRYEEIRKNTTP